MKRPVLKLKKTKPSEGERAHGFVRIQTLFLILGLSLFGYSLVMADRPQTKLSQADKLFARAKDDDYTGSVACAECHEGKFNHFNESPHAMFMSDEKLPLSKRGCEGCHGPGKIHQSEDNPENISFRKMSPKEASAACLRCHEKTMTTSHWKRTEHAQADVSCVSCHQIHTDSDPDLPGLRKGQDPRSFAFTGKVNPKAMLRADEATLCGSCHPSATGDFRSANHHPIPEGSMACSDCHNAHPSKAQKAKVGQVKGSCVTCHTEKAGPFVFEHDPVAGIGSDGCQECHRPHGSNNPAMLNSVTRGLCAQCHTEKLSSHYPGKNCWNSGCHVATHGSNTDSKFLAH